jgi:hypothetical protein
MILSLRPDAERRAYPDLVVHSPCALPHDAASYARSIRGEGAEALRFVAAIGGCGMALTDVVPVRIVLIAMLGATAVVTVIPVAAVVSARSVVTRSRSIRSKVPTGSGNDS